MPVELTQPGPRYCPSCDALIGNDAILCVQCGYHFERQVHLPSTLPVTNPPAPPKSNPFQPSPPWHTTEEESTKLLSMLWIHGRIPRWQWWTYQMGYFGMLAALSELVEKQVIPFSVAAILFLMVSWVALMAQVKRWHDMNRTGLWCFVNLVPIFGIFYAFIELGFQRGTTGRNEFGDDPIES